MVSDPNQLCSARLMFRSYVTHSSKYIFFKIILLIYAFLAETLGNNKGLNKPFIKFCYARGKKALDSIRNLLALKV